MTKGPDGVVRPLYSRIRRGCERVNEWLAVLAGISLGGMVVAISVAVAVRLLFTFFGVQLSAPWGEELARYLMVWSVFIGGAVAASRGRMIGVEALVNVMPTGPARLMRIGGHLCTLALFAIFVWLAIILIDFGFRQTSPVMRIPMAWVYAGLFLGSAFIFINTLVLLVGELLGIDPDSGPAEEEEIAPLLENREVRS